MFVTRLSKTLTLFFVTVVLTGCSLLQPYQAELGQGNFIREEQVLQLELGQTPEQVVFLLGTPLLTGEAQANRWVYPTYESSQGYKTLAVSFEEGLVSAIERK